MARFDWVYGNTGVQQKWDIDLTPHCEFATVPTVGAMLTNWLLFMPREHHVSIANMKSDARVRLLRHARRIMNRLEGQQPNDGVAFFEHGAGNTGSLVGCGVDHAHLHAVPLPFKLSESLLEELHTVVTADPLDPWSSVRAPEYLLCIDKTGAYVAPPLKPVSQFFRRKIASNIGKGELWNYKDHPFTENIVTTVRNFHV